MQKVLLSDLTPDCRSIFVVGIIIAKQEPRKFNETKGEAPRERAVWSFTLRDSPTCYINVTCWGSKEEIFAVNNKFHMGDVGKSLFLFSFKRIIYVISLFY